MIAPRSAGPNRGAAWAGGAKDTTTTPTRASARPSAKRSVGWRTTFRMLHRLLLRVEYAAGDAVDEHPPTEKDIRHVTEARICFGAVLRELGRWSSADRAGAWTSGFVDWRAKCQALCGQLAVAETVAGDVVDGRPVTEAAVRRVVGARERFAAVLSEFGGWR